uniref:Uncharacterized protein n=1 Tax=Oryza glumipatula TaxID=40148 RepID=A0A0E0BN70_9ORYZ
MVSLLRCHPNPLLAASVPAHLLRRFSALPDVDHPPLPTSTPTPASTCSSILDLQHAVCGEADLARIHSLVATTLSRPDDYPCLHGSRPLFSLAVSCLPRLRRLDLAVSLLCALLDSALASPAARGVWSWLLLAGAVGGATVAGVGREGADAEGLAGDVAVDGHLVSTQLLAFDDAQHRQPMHSSNGSYAAASVPITAACIADGRYTSLFTGTSYFIAIFLSDPACMNIN